MTGSLARSLQAFVYGITLPLRAGSVILRSPALLAASAVPWLLSLALDIWVVHRLQQALSTWIEAQLSGSLQWAAVVLGWIALFVAGVLAFSFIASVIALPVNDFLAELTEPRANPPLPSTGSISWAGRARLLTIDLFKTVCALSMSVLALLLSWMPVVNLVGAVLAFMLIAFQFLSYPQTRRGEGVLAGVRFLALNFWSSLGFGMSFAFLFAIPIVSSFALPLAVVGGTLLYARSRPLLPGPANSAH